MKAVLREETIEASKVKLLETYFREWVAVHIQHSQFREGQKKGYRTSSWKSLFLFPMKMGGPCLPAVRIPDSMLRK
jgi:hypothetical protein